MSNPLTAILILVGLVVVILVLFLLLKSAVREGVNASRSDSIPSLKESMQAMKLIPAVADRPGRFKISGVDRTTKQDTTRQIEAQSEANARAKAELEGIVVTRVERVG